MMRPRRSTFISAVLLLLCLLLSSCAQEKAGAEQRPDDILTQTVVPEGKITLTVLVKYAFAINAFEKAVEEKFPQLDLIQVGNYTKDRGLIEYARRLEHDDLTDIVMTWPLDVGEEYWAERLLDLSGMAFTANYNTPMLHSIAKEGKLYYLPGPAQVRGIVYNKTLFEEKGWTVPSDFDGFVSLCREIEANGIRSLVLPFGNAEVLDTAFVGYSYGDCFNTPGDAQWIVNYNGGAGSFGDHFAPALDTFQSLIDAGLWKPEDLDITYAERETMLFTRQCAMVEDSVLLARMGFNQTGTSDKFALMPFFSPESGTDWARLYMVCYIGLNKHLAEPVNQEKYELALQLMEYISSPEGQAALAADTGAMYSSVKGVPPPDVPEITDLIPALTAGRYAIFPELKNAQGALRQGLAGMVAGKLSTDDVIQMVDAGNTTSFQSSASDTLGTATADFSLIETGNFVTDAMRAASGADVALFLDNGKDGRYNGKGISARFYAGEQIDADLSRILPDLKHGEQGVLQTVTMTGADLRHVLEYAVTVDHNAAGWFYYFSGLRAEYAPAAEPGSRIRSLTDLNGKELVSDRVYSVAVMDGSLPPEVVRSCLDLNIFIHDVVADAIRTQGSISPSGDGRFTVCVP